MEYRTHRYGGMCAGAIAATAMYGTSYLHLDNIDPHYIINASILIGAGAIGSLIPDIDHQNSYISKRNPILAFIVKLLLGIANFITKIILSLCFWISPTRKKAILAGTEHRGIFHTLLMVILIYLLFGILTAYFGEFGYLLQIGLTVGYLSHILVDMLTKGGVMLLYPAITFKFHYPFIRLTTGKHETIAAIIITIVTVITIYLLIH